MVTEHMIKALPLIAAVLGQKYGVKVKIGGSQACTDGKTIQIPLLPSDGNSKTLVATVRGYLDHEAAHVRETDFTALIQANLSPLQGFLTNVIEDWRVENKLGELFQGCRGNFNWLIEHIFGSEEYKQDACTGGLEDLIPKYILISVRSWDVQKLSGVVDRIGDRISILNALLLAEINSILQEVRIGCTCTQDSIDYARKIVDSMEGYAKKEEIKNKASPRGDDKSGEVQLTGTSEKSNTFSNPQSKQAISSISSSLSKLISKPSSELPDNIGEVLAVNLEKSSVKCSEVNEGSEVAIEGHKRFTEFDSDTLAEVKRVESVLRTRLKTGLQSVQLQRGSIGNSGKLKTTRLALTSVGERKVFSRPAEKIAVNTAVHILLDCSGSMRKRIKLTTASCLALASGLSSIHGVNVGVTAFPAINSNSSCPEACVAPVVRHGKPVHAQFDTNASGTTPMGEALWWVLQQMIMLKEERKIVLIITDGYPSSRVNVDTAISAGRDTGLEFYGIGICCNSVNDLSLHKGCVINRLSDLAEAMFDIFKDAII